MSQHPSTEVVAAATAAAASKAKAKKIARVSGAAAFTFAMFGALALPAYALDDARPAAELLPPPAAVQTMNVTAGPALTPIDDIPLEVSSSVVEQERRQAEIAEAEKQAAERARLAVIAAIDIPAGSGASGLVNAALAQLGVSQDCTALVEKSLRAIGYSVGDLNPVQFGAYGPTTRYVHGETALAAGDILIYNPYGDNHGAHVAIYIGGNQAVHGGWTGYTTVIAGLGTYNGLPTHVVRMS